MLDVLVSVVMPVYNVSKYVERALMSVLYQTYKNIEVVIVDDCGIDNSMQIVYDIIDKYDVNAVCRVVHHDVNRGLSAARNTGIKKSKGQYIYFFDSDDELTPDCIYKLVCVASKYPNVEIVTGNMTVLTEQGVVVDRLRYFTDVKEENKHEYYENVEQITNIMFNYSSNIYLPIVAQNKLYKKKWMSQNNLSFVEGLIHEDEKFLFDIANCVSCIGICYDSTYLRYINPNSIMTSLTKEKNADSFIYIIKSSYHQLRNPLLGLKIRYCIFILKDVIFSVAGLKTNLYLFDEVKCLLRQISWFSINKGYLVESFYAWLLICLPRCFFDNRLLIKFYRCVYRNDFLLKQ